MGKKKFFMVTLIVLAISFVGCKNKEIVNNSAIKESETSIEQNNNQEEATTEITTEETGTEETGTEETGTEETGTEETVESGEKLVVEYTCYNIPESMENNAKRYTEYEIGAYLYGDIDRDEEKELLAAYLDESVGQWKILRFENEKSEPEEFYSIELASYKDHCSLGLIVLNGKIYYTVDLQSSLVATETTAYILKENEDGVEEILSVYGYAVLQGENGDIILQSTYYGACLYKPTGMMEGRVWGYSYLKYDEESGQFSEYVANEITEEEFLAYEGAKECLGHIKALYTDYDAKYSFYKRNNGLMHIQCEYEDEYYIYYDNYGINYSDGIITYVNQKEQGQIAGKFTSLDEV